MEFSVEELVQPAYWFPDEGEGVWEWKGRVVVEGDCAYGKFYQNKACYISMEWFPDFVNYRRSRCHLSAVESEMLSTIRSHGSLLSRELKKLCGYTHPRSTRIANPLERMAEQQARHIIGRKKPGRESFDTAITRLQMGGWVVTADFEYDYDKQGRRYGWGVARYCAATDFFGAERMSVKRSPEESHQRIVDHLHLLLPQATDAEIARFVG